jgi:hypothetical protein
VEDRRAWPSTTSSAERSVYHDDEALYFEMIETLKEVIEEDEETSQDGASSPQ